MTTCWKLCCTARCRLLSSNRGLNGTLPAAWSSLSNLQTVHLDDGNFTGVCIAVRCCIVQHVQPMRLCCMQVVDLANAPQTPLVCAGQLPASWSKMSQLREMSLSSNALTGTVPARLAALSFLDLSRNQLLCGSPPSTAANATLRTQRTSLGQDCSALVAARLSGIRGVILGEHGLNTPVSATQPKACRACAPGGVAVSVASHKALCLFVCCRCMHRCGGLSDTRRLSFPCHAAAPSRPARQAPSAGIRFQQARQRQGQPRPILPLQHCLTF